MMRKFPNKNEVQTKVASTYLVSTRYVVNVLIFRRQTALMIIQQIKSLEVILIKHVQVRMKPPANLQQLPVDAGNWFRYWSTTLDDAEMCSTLYKILSIFQCIFE